MFGELIVNDMVCFLSLCVLIFVFDIKSFVGDKFVSYLKMVCIVKNEGFEGK